MRRAAMLAIWLADDHLVLRGRARDRQRLVPARGPHPRRGRALSGARLARRACWGTWRYGEGDQARARELAVRARELGRRLGVVSLEMFALSVEGVALVNEGEVGARHGLPRRGHRRGARGRVRGDRARGVDLLPAARRLRARARLRARRRVVRQGRGVRPQDEDQFRHRRLPAALRRGADMAGALGRGRAGAHRATEYLVAERPTWSGLAIVRLADLRRRQGRFAEAQELLHRAEGNALTPVVMAEIALDEGDTSAAGDLLEPVLRRVPARTGLCGLAPVEVMVRAKAAAGEARRSGCAPLGAALDRGGRGHASAARLGELLRGTRRGRRRRRGDCAREARGRGRAVRRERGRLRARASAARARAGARLVGSQGRSRARGDAGAQSVSTRSGRRPRRRGRASWSGDARGLTGGHAAPRRRSAPHPSPARGRCGWSRRVSRTRRSRRGSCSASTPSTATFKTRTRGWVARRAPRRWRRRTG